jgi:hypothetical protein
MIDQWHVQREQLRTWAKEQQAQEEVADQYKWKSVLTYIDSFCTLRDYRNRIQDVQVLSLQSIARWIAQGCDENTDHYILSYRKYVAIDNAVLAYLAALEEE